MYSTLFYQIVDAIFIVLGKTGKLLNIRGHKICFLLNAFVCSWWLYIDLQRELYAQAAAVFITICLDIYGWFYWKRNKIGK